MTTTTIARPTDSPRRRAVNADLVFWSAVGAIVAALSGPLAHWWHAPREVLLVGGLSFALLGPVALLGLYRIRRVPRRLVAGFVAANAVLAPIAAAAAWFNWLGLSAAGTWALADAAAATLLLGVWQFSAWRR